LKPDRKVVPQWFICIESGDLEGLTRLVDFKELADVDASITTEKWDGGLTVLGRAALMGNCAMVELLIKRGADPDKVCATHSEKKFYSPGNKFTPIGAAISICNADMVGVMLNEGASAKRVCFNDAWTPMEYALSKLSSRLDGTLQHYTEEAQAEKKKKTEVDDKELLSIIELLLSNGAVYDEESKLGRHTPVGTAVMKGQLPTLRVLLKKGARVEKVCLVTTGGTHEYTPLGLAVVLRFDDVAEMLRAAGAQDTPFKFGGNMVRPSELHQVLPPFVA
jgi:ankyrin repeat protein